MADVPDRVPVEGGFIDLVHHQIYRDGVQTALTPIEVRFIAHLLRADGRPVERQELLVEVWEYAASSRSRAVDFAVRRLRAKIEADPKNPKHLLAVPKVGYRFEPGLGSVELDVPEKQASGLGRSQPEPLSAMTNLPPVPNDLVGRQEGLATLGGQIDGGATLINICGPPGIGKTRLALAYGIKERLRYPGGVWFCDLSAATTEKDIEAEVRRALGKASVDEESVEHFLARQPPFLLILDNFEQLLDLATRTVGRWHHASAESVFLVTSRSALQLAEEHLLPLAPLDVGRDVTDLDREATGHIAAVRMFIARARRAMPRFELTEDNAPVILDIVRRLEGVPLAIELAAGRVRYFRPAQILQRLTTQMTWLSASARDAHRRHTTLDATLDWSWELLEDWEQAGLAQCAIFREGFGIDEADAIVDLKAWGRDGSEAVASLVDHSLIRGPDWASGHDRFEMLEFVRSYAAQKMMTAGAWAAPDGSMEAGPDGLKALRERHGRWYCDLDLSSLEFARQWIRAGGDEVCQLRADWGNLMAALESGQALGSAEMAARAGLKLGELHIYTGWTEEHLERIKAARAVPSLDPVTDWYLTFRAGWGASECGQSERANALFTHALEAAETIGEVDILAESLGMLAEQRTVARDLDTARSLLKRALDLCANAGDGAGVAIQQARMGAVSFVEGDVASARTWMEPAVTVLREADLPQYEIRFGQILAEAYRQEGNLEQCSACWELAWQRCAEVGDRIHSTRADIVLGMRSAQEGDFEQGLERLERARRLTQVIGSRKDWARICLRVARVRLDMGDLDAAIKEYERGVPMMLEGGTALDLGSVHQLEAELALAGGRWEDAHAAIEAACAVSGANPPSWIEETRERIEAARGAAS